VAPGGGRLFDLLHVAGSPRRAPARPSLLLSFADLKGVMQQQGMRLAHVYIWAQPLLEGTPPIPGRVLARRPGADAVEPEAADQAAWNLWREFSVCEATDAVALEVRVSGLMRKAP
jgi:hypothetical protein